MQFLPFVAVRAAGNQAPSPTVQDLPLLPASLPRLLLGGLATAVALAALGLGLDAARLRPAAGALAAEPWLLALAFLPYMAAFWLRAVAWTRLLPGLSTAQAFSILHAGLFANHLLPVKAGELLRPYLAARRGTETTLTDSFTTTLVARLMDFSALLVILVAALPLVGGAAARGWAAAGAVGTGVVLATALLGVVRAKGQTSAAPGLVGRALRAVGGALKQVTSRRLAEAFLWTLPSWVLEASVLVAASRLLGLDLPLHAALAATAFTILLQVVHVTPGGLGIYESSMTVALAAFGMPLEEGLALAVLTHGMKFLYAYTVGLAFTLWEARAAMDTGRSGEGGAERQPTRGVKRTGLPPRVLCRLSLAAAGCGLLGLWLVMARPLSASWPTTLLVALAAMPVVVLLVKTRVPGRAKLVLWLSAALVTALTQPSLAGLGLVGWGVMALMAATAPSRVLRTGGALFAWALEHAPKALLASGLFLHGTQDPSWATLAEVELAGVALVVLVLLARQWLPAKLPPPQSNGASVGPVAVVIPAFNEAANLPGTLARVPKEEVPDLRVIVVDDGSMDGTAEIARRSGADVVVSHQRNLGLGAALRTGLAAARDMGARAAVYVDADGEYDPEEIPGLLAPIDRGEADYVLGSRYLGTRADQTAARLLGNVVFTALLSFLAGRLITDGQTGFRAFSRRALESAEIIHDYNYAQVLTLDLLRKGMWLAQAPISWRRRRKGRSFIGGAYLWRVPLGIAREMLAD